MATQRSTDNIDVPNRREVAWGVAPGGYQPQGDLFTLKAGAVVNPYRAVKFGADTAHVIQGAAATDTTIGISQAPQAAAAEDYVMIAMFGLAKMEVGAAGVTAGDLLTSDTVGRAVTSLAAPTDRVIGVALQTGTVGQIIDVVISQSKNGGVT